MRGMKEKMMAMVRRISRLVAHSRRNRVGANRNAHVLTPHGKVQTGRKGRKG